MSSLNDSSKEKKLAIISALEMISQGSESPIKRKSQENMLNKILPELGLNHTEWSAYIQHLNPSLFQQTLKSLSAMETEFYLGYIFELLHQNDKPTNQEITIAKNACQKVSGISEIQFDKTMEKFSNMGNFWR